jgi:hypothetical protein
MKRFRAAAGGPADIGTAKSKIQKKSIKNGKLASGRETQSNKKNIDQSKLKHFQSADDQLDKEYQTA